MLRRLEGEQPCSSGLSCCLLCRLSWPHLINWFYKRLWFTPSCFLLIFLFQCWQNVPVIHEINFQHGTSHILWLEYLAFMLIPTTMSFSSSGKISFFFFFKVVITGPSCTLFLYLSTSPSWLEWTPYWVHRHICCVIMLNFPHQQRIHVHCEYNIKICGIAIRNWT